MLIQLRIYVEALFTYGAQTLQIKGVFNIPTPTHMFKCQAIKQISQKD
jgi:hypothetical protein